MQETIYFADAKPSMNKDLGRHHLPSVYSSFIQSHGLSSSEGRVHCARLSFGFQLLKKTRRQEDKKKDACLKLQ